MKLRRVLIDIGHPAQVHQFRHVYKELSDRGYDVLFTTKDKDIALYLLNSYKIPYTNLGKPKKGLIRKVLYIPSSCFRFYQVVRSFKPDIVLSRFSFHASWVSFILRKKHIGFTDTEHVGLADTLTVPFVKTKLTAFSYTKDFGKNHMRYSGSIELFYLHPNRFTPNKSVLDLLGVKENDKYVIIRFISWNAHHDIGQKGISLAMKYKMIEELSKIAKVYISSEGELPNDLEKYRIQIPFEKMHDVLYFASLYIGEGATMAEEAAVLGTPAIYMNSLSGGVIEDLVRAGLIFHYTDSAEEQEDAFENALKLVKSDKTKITFSQKREKLLQDKIDVSAFTVWFVENYPESIRIIKDNPDYQYRFK